MKTFWLVGKKEGAEAAQTFMSMVGGHTTAIGPHGEGNLSQSTHSVPPGMESLFKEDKDIEGEDEVVIPQKDSPVAYYGHVPHTPHNSNGMLFNFEKVWKLFFLKCYILGLGFEQLNGGGGGGGWGVSVLITV